jgi:hypothetical protein
VGVALGRRRGLGGGLRSDDRGLLHHRRVRHPDPSAEESRGLETWLTQNGYRIPRGASEVLGSYLKQGMRFFVAKVNLAEQRRLGY